MKTTPKKIPMSPKRRQMILEIVDSEVSLLPVMHYLTAFKRCDFILEWLIRNRMTGKNLMQWIGIRWANSLLSMVKYILMKLDHETEMKPIYLGGEYLG